MIVETLTQQKCHTNIDVLTALKRNKKKIMSNKIRDLIKAYDKITDNKDVLGKLNIATSIREESDSEILMFHCCFWNNPL